MHETRIHSNQSPRPRVNPQWQARQARKFSIASGIFAASTVIFMLLLFLSIATGVEGIFNVGIGIVFLAWFPSLCISARCAKYYDPWGLDEILSRNR